MFLKSTRRGPQRPDETRPQRPDTAENHSKNVYNVNILGTVPLGDPGVYSTIPQGGPGPALDPLYYYGAIAGREKIL